MVSGTSRGFLQSSDWASSYDGSAVSPPLPISSVYSAVNFPVTFCFPHHTQAEEVDARLLSGLITGVRRAFPYVKPEDVEPLVEQSANQFFRLVHTAPFTVAVQALMLMYQLMSARAAINERCEYWFGWDAGHCLRKLRVGGYCFLFTAE